MVVSLPASNILIVGAGLGGLASAIAIKLASPQHNVRILESTSEIKLIGAGIQISPNISRLLIRWGCEPFLKDKTVFPQYSRIYRWEDASLLTEGPSNADGNMLRNFRSPFWHVHRADLHTAMFERCRQLGVEILVNHHVVDADAETGTVILLDGRKIEGDLIVGADGIKSTMRTVLKGFPVPPQNTPDYCYRFALPVASLQDDPGLAKLTEIPLSILVLGPSKHVVIYLLHAGQILNVVASFPDDGTLDETSKGPATLDELRERFKGWNSVVTALMSRARDVTKWKLMDLPPLDIWARDRLVLIGDSVHPMLPHMAAGAGQAIEDGAVLGQLISSLPISLIGPTYQSLRHSRASQVQSASRAQGLKNHLPDGPLQIERDATMKQGTLGAMSHNWKEWKSWWRTDDIGPRNWNDGLFGYDAEQHAKIAIQNLKFKNPNNSDPRFQI